MKTLIVLLSATAALANHTNPYHQGSPFPVTSLVFTIIFSVVTLLNVLWIIKVAKSKPDLRSADVEKHSLVNSTLPEGVVSTNINVSAKSRPSLLGELRNDENLVWAHENAAPLRTAIIILLSISLVIAATGLATSIAFMCVLDGYMDIVFLSMWMPFIFTNFILYLTAGLMHKMSGSSVIYALTSKRVFIFSSLKSGCCGGNTETVRAYDLDGIHQTTLTRKDDGTGTLTFSAAAIADGGYHGHHHHYGMFAFSNIPNVTAVKDLIEQYKTLRKKQAGNQ